MINNKPLSLEMKIPTTTNIREPRMPKPSQPVQPSESPWHLLGAAIRHWREDVRCISLRTTAQRIYADPSDLSRWERGLTHPHISAVQRLDDALDAKGQLAALHDAVSDLDRLRTLEGNAALTEETATERRRLIQLAGSLALGAVGGSETVRQALDHEPGRSVEEWEVTCADHLHALRTRPPTQVIADLTVDVLALRRQAQSTAPADLTEVQRTTAALSAIFANALTRLSDHGAAIRWWRTARQAADASGDLSLSLLIRGEEAGHGLYGQRSPETVLNLVNAAQHLAKGPSVDLMTTEAKALSLLGRHQEAVNVIRRAMAQAGTVKGDSLGFWSPDILRFAASWIFSAVGEENQASESGTTVLASTRDYVYRTNIVLHRSLCTVVNGGVTEGTQQAAAVIAEVPPAYRSGHVLATGRMVLQAVPLDQRDHAGVDDLREQLKLV
ncbi:hypothetical protein GCM10009555_020490 [Acrocarpospora macrocephala]|uniref:HTH cro/C1-type domain-containing protein n=1 Tax=Acrocarpospora macrocephala TaxID=150177 RepID=A0A5M3WL49_9ACTN|nr:helix-turn-helix transcriptional regulator [Acrocarpospora macrocephala]GES07951.1 hypothetical protein Amac_015460 [Acrocarpospora macrocephala]